MIDDTPSVEVELRGRVLRFVADPAADDFEALALAAFRFQHQRLEPYRRLARRQGRDPEAVSRWQDVPAVPTAAFKRLALCVAPPAVVFRSSGTTAGRERRSEHHQPYPELYLAAVDASFPGHCLPAQAPVPMLSLIPGRDQIPDSSLSFMASHVVERYGSSASLFAFGPGGLALDAADSWARERTARGEPVLVLATALALAAWLDARAATGADLPLPPGSLVFETGGFKGRRREIARAELVAGVERQLGVPPSHVVREYGMTELSSQLYTRAKDGGDPDLFVAPHWTRVRVLDPTTLEETAAGEPGLVTVLDLANLGSALQVMTEDLGVVEGEGLRLLGRAAGAELRGCSQVVEELSP